MRPTSIPRLPLVSLCFVLLAASFDARAASVVIGASRDNTVYAEDSTSSNGAGEYFHAGMNGVAQVRRGLVAFDVAAAIPAGATIDSVALRLNTSQTQAGDRIVSLHRVLANWGEGTSDAPFGEGIGTPATPGDATWTFSFFDTTLWANEGGDFDSNASASQLVGTFGFYTWSSGGMRDDVQSWLDSPAGNFGWILIGNETNAATAKRFDSHQRAVVANRPALMIFYTGAPTAVGSAPAALARLLPAFPSPFNPSTTISFETAVRGHVRLSIFDPQGRLVRVLAEATFPAGTHSVNWRGDDARGRVAASGVYFVKLEASGVEAAQKIVLLK
jgi:hypothetical protein